MSSKMPPKVYTRVLDVTLKDKLLADLRERGFEISFPPHAFFSAKKPGLSCTFYQSGKLVVQGKEAVSFCEFYLEPEVIEAVALAEPQIGVDESGKGDFFGPLCVAAVCVYPETSLALQRLGVRDSKTLSDTFILQEAGPQIRQVCPFAVLQLLPDTYNRLYQQFGNLNTLLAWGHATVIGALTQKTGCSRVVIDQFGHERLVLTALAKKQVVVHLTQRHRGEEELAVAAASILARESFLRGLERLISQLEYILPKGCGSSVPKEARYILCHYGEKALLAVCKHHFKTLKEVLEDNPKGLK